MPKQPEDFFETNLTKLYELEGKRKKISELAEERIKKGESLSTPEILKESEEFHKMMVDENMLEKLSRQLAEENEVNNINNEEERKYGEND